jgi:hypothetical protein
MAAQEPGSTTDGPEADDDEAVRHVRELLSRALLVDRSARVDEPPCFWCGHGKMRHTDGHCHMCGMLRMGHPNHEYKPKES